MDCWIGLDGAVGLFGQVRSIETIKLPDFYCLVKGTVAHISRRTFDPLRGQNLAVNSRGVFDLRKAASGEILITPLVNLINNTASAVITAEVFGSNLFIGTMLDGVIRFDLKTRELTKIKQGTRDSDVPSDTITAMMVDEENLLVRPTAVYTEDNGRSFRRYEAFSSGLPSN